MLIAADLWLKMVGRADKYNYSSSPDATSSSPSGSPAHSAPPVLTPGDIELGSIDVPEKEEGSRRLRMRELLLIILVITVGVLIISATVAFPLEKFQRSHLQIQGNWFLML